MITAYRQTHKPIQFVWLLQQYFIRCFGRSFVQALDKHCFPGAFYDDGVVPANLLYYMYYYYYCCCCYYYYYSVASASSENIVIITFCCCCYARNHYHTRALKLNQQKIITDRTDILKLWLWRLLTFRTRSGCAGCAVITNALHMHYITICNTQTAQVCWWWRQQTPL